MTETDADLLARTRDDARAFGVFYRRHARWLLGRLLRYTHDAETAADLAAETFAVALETAPRYDAARGEAEAWLWGIARHKLADAQRAGFVADRARRRLGIGAIALDDEAVERIEALASLDMDAAVLSEALESLPADQRHAVNNRIVLERSYAEIATDTSTSESAVRKRVSRGLSTLRGLLGAHDD